jgi:hypothetical protein
MEHIINDEERQLVGSASDQQRFVVKQSPTIYHESPKRWSQLALFSLLSMSNALLWITFAPISNQAQSYYNVHTIWINCMATASSTMQLLALQYVV